MSSSPPRTDVGAPVPPADDTARRGATAVAACHARPALVAVLFDMDGLLVDSEPLWYDVEREVMARLGGDWGPDDQRALLGSALDFSVGYMLRKAPGTHHCAAEVGRWLVEGMARLITARGLPLLPGARELLSEVAAAGLPYALVTSSQRLIMDTVLAVTGVSFPVTVCGEDVDRGKPAPDPYLRAAALLGVDPRGCVALEDSANGAASAQAAGCVVVVVPSAPLPRAPGRVAVPSLRDVDLAMLSRLVSGGQPAR